MIELIELTMDNFEECIKLQVHDSQLGFVASNAYSLSEAFVDKVSEPRAIYADGKMVGFIMYYYEPDTETGTISRLMIDKHFQKNGYAREAMEMVINLFKEMQECKYIELSYCKDNKYGASFYKKMGFLVDEKQPEANDEITWMTMSL